MPRRPCVPTDATRALRARLDALFAAHDADGAVAAALAGLRDGIPIEDLYCAVLVPLLTDCTRFALSGSAVTASFEIAPDLWLADFDENQLSQVIDNLIINAQQAMPQGGTIVVSAAMHMMGPKFRAVRR
jgi:signal transduction histidine kinase